MFREVDMIFEGVKEGGREKWWSGRKEKIEKGREEMIKKN